MKLQTIMIYSTADQNSFSRNWCWDIWCSWRTLFISPNRCNAMCVQVSCLCDDSRSLDGRRGATFTMKPVACCVALRSKVVNDATGVSVRADRIEKRLWGLDNYYRCKKKRCIPPQAGPEVLAASGIKPPGLTDRRRGGTGEPVVVEYAQ